MSTFWQDLRYGLRLLRKNPGFTLVAILTMAVGIGGTTTIFSIVDAVLLEPLSYSNPDQLLSLSNTDKERGLTGISVSFTKLERIQQEAHTLSSVAGFFPSSVSLKQTSAIPDQLPSAQVSGDFFKTLGVSPALGREFLPQEDQPGGAEVVIVSNRLWRLHFAGDPG